jgi:phage terminase small subunit
MKASHQRFIDEYLVDLDVARAARAAGYMGSNPSYPTEAGCRLLKRPDIKAALAARKAAQAERADLTAVAVLDQLRALSMVDMRAFFDASGSMKPPSEWTEDMGRAVMSFDVVKRNVTSGDGKVDDVFRVRLADKVRSLEMLAKHFGLLIDRVDHSGAVVFVHEQLDQPTTVTVESLPLPALGAPGGS